MSGHTPFAQAAALLLALLAGGCATPQPFDQVTQLAPLPAGGPGAVLPLHDLQRYGTLGAGSLASGDGDAFWDGPIAFHLRSDGNVYNLPPTARLRFGLTARFRPDLVRTLPEAADRAAVTELLRAAAPDASLLCAVRLVGRFETVALVAAGTPADDAPLRRVSGTLIGFRLPPGRDAAQPAGLLLWFLSNDLLVGGRVADFRLVDGTLAIDFCDRHLTFNPGAARAALHGRD